MNLNRSYRLARKRRRSKKKLVAKSMKFTITEMDSFPYNLPDTCLNILFDNLPLEDLLHCNLVCHKWNELYRAACSRRRRLTLIIGTPNNLNNRTPYHFVSNSALNSQPFANWDDKLSPIRHSWLMRMNGKLKPRLVTGLMHNLANITTLEIILTEIPFEALDQVIKLLNFWADKLVTLKIWFDFQSLWRRSDFDKMDSMEHRLIDAINSLSLLTHLTINYESNEFYKKDANNEPILLIQLENLKEFNWNNHLSNTHVFEAICRYAQSHPNLRVGLDTRFTETEDVEVLFFYGHRVASQFTQLCLYNSVTEQLLTRVCGHFPNLTTLQLLSSILPAAEWTKAIAQCSQLVHLRLELELEKVKKCPDMRTHPTKQEITQLKCIKMLSIELNSYSHDDLKTLQFTWIFPNLQMIYIYVFDLNCNICGTNDHFGNPKITQNKERYDQCVKLLLSPLKEFQHLEVIKVFTNTNGYVLYSKEDL